MLIEGRGVALKRWREGDAEAFEAAVTESAEHLRPGLPGWHTSRWRMDGRPGQGVPQFRTADTYAAGTSARFPLACAALTSRSSDSQAALSVYPAATRAL